MVIYFVALYLPSQGNYESIEASIDEISELIHSREDRAMIVVAGDFNGDVGRQGGPRGLREATSRGKKVQTFFDRHDLIPLNMQEGATGPVETYEGPLSKSTLDYIAIPSVMLPQVIKCYVHDWSALNTSDHLPVSAHLYLKEVLYTHIETRPKGRIKWEKLSGWDKFTRYQLALEPLLNKIKSEFSMGTKNPAEIDHTVEKLIDSIHRISVTLPHTQYRKHLKPYWDENLSALKRRKVSSYKAWVFEGRPREGDNLFYLRYKSDKNIFHSALKATSKRYENEEVMQAIKTAELDRNAFWRLVNHAKKGQIRGISAIKRKDKTVVHDLPDVLQTWADHFSSIGTPKEADNYDQHFYDEVSDLVSRYNNLDDVDGFLEQPFSTYEISKAIGTLHSNKAPGYDEITAEHLKYAGPVMTDILYDLFKAIIDNEYIPDGFRRGVQVPLYKGKDTCTLDPNNYRGITLLPTFNKVFEILIWNRVKGWWQDDQVISEMQGACRVGHSCVHTSFNLRETLAATMEASDKCFIAFFDVAKAFDTVWIDGLFKQIYDLGLRGKTWRLLYRCYIDFKCCVKIKGTFSEWYSLQCGIHQGGFMSLMKYTVFINSLLVKLKNENICCKIYRTPSTPLGYADDIATACVSKTKIDRAMDIVYNHGCTWRYNLNAKKSGILVLGESRTEHERNSQDRLFKLGPNRVKEKTFYDHVGIRNCIFANDYSGIEERISKGRRAFNSLAGIGIRKGGLTMATCNVVFWSVVVPTALYGCEMWILDDGSLSIIEEFQNFIGKRIQRIHPKAPNTCSYYGLGWMRLERIIQIRKLMFIRTIMVMEDSALSKIIFKERAARYFLNDGADRENPSNSTVYDLLNVSSLFGLLEEVKNMVERDHIYSKQKWREKIWRRGWNLEDVYWEIERHLHKSLDLLSRVNSPIRYIVWWGISDKYPILTAKCEIMTKILCHASILRDDDFRLKRQSRMQRMCTLCDQYAVEDARHFLLQCPFYQVERERMFFEISNVDISIDQAITDAGIDILYIVLGHSIEGVCDQFMEEIWIIILNCVTVMYLKNTQEKRGVG